MIQRHREARERDLAAEQTEADKAVPQTPVATPPTEETVMPKAEPVKEAPAKPAVAKTEAPKPEPVKTEAPKPAVQPKAEAPKPVTKVQPKPVAGNYYVQVESLTKDPRADYVKQLKDKGFNVVVRDRVVDGKAIKRVYVGPYTTKEEAAAVLPNLRRDFNPEAFVIQD